MRCQLISDNVDTRMGMRLAGIEGVILHEHDEILSELRRYMNDPEIAVVFLTEKVAACIAPEVKVIKETVSKPLIAVIPDRHGTSDMTAELSRYLQQTVGIHI